MAYASTQEVAYVLRGLMPGATPPSDFSTTTNPANAEVTMWLDLSTAEIEFTLAMVGFKTPPAHLGGGALDTRESNFLKLLNIFGAASYIADALKPTPTVGPSGRFGANSVFRDRYKQMLDMITKTNGYGMRLDAFVGSAAANMQANVRAPLSDFRENKHDSRDYLGLMDFTRITDQVNLHEADIRLWNFSDLISWSNLSGAVA